MYYYYGSFCYFVDSTNKKKRFIMLIKKQTKCQCLENITVHLDIFYAKCMFFFLFFFNSPTAYLNTQFLFL